MRNRKAIALQRREQDCLMPVNKAVTSFEQFRYESFAGFLHLIRIPTMANTGSSRESATAETTMSHTRFGIVSQ